MKPSRSFLAILALLAGTSAAQAQTSTWNSTGGGTWNATASWVGGIPNSSTANATFSQDFTGSPIVTLDNSAGFTVNRITYNDTGASTDSTLTINTGTGGNLTFAGTTPTIDVSTLNPTSASLTINAVLAGSNGLNKTGGAGTLVLGGTNTYSGTTTIDSPDGGNGVPAIRITNASALGSSSVLLRGRANFAFGLQVANNLTVNNALTLQRGAGGTGRATLALGTNTDWQGNITLDNTATSGLAIIVAGGSGNANASIVSGNIGFSTLSSNANADVTFRGNNLFGKMTGQVNVAGGSVGFLDGTNWEFSNASNTWGEMQFTNNGTIIYVGATNTLSATGVVTSQGGLSTRGTLRLNNMAGDTAYSQTIGGLDDNNLGFSPNVDLTTGAATLTLNATANQSYSGVISGNISLVKTGNATQTLLGVSTYTGTTTITGGTLAIAAVTNSGVSGPLGNATSAVSMGNAGGVTGTLEYTGATASSNRSFTAVTGGTARFSTSNASSVLTLSGTIGGNGDKRFSGNGSYSVTGALQGSGSVTKNGTGTLTLVGAKTYSGATNVSGGTLALSSTGSFDSSPVITVATGATLDVSAKSGGFSLVPGQTIQGTGTVVGDLLIASGSTLSPGNSPGNMVVTGNSTWAGNATYHWEINDALGSAGNATTGWDLQTITGNLSITATSGIGDQFIIDIVGLNASNVEGSVVNWDDTQDYAWLIADSGSEISSFALDKFTFLTGNFTNNNSANGTFGIARGDSVGGDNTQVYLTFTAVPEPTTLALAAIGLAGLGIAARRRRS